MLDPQLWLRVVTTQTNIIHTKYQSWLLISAESSKLRRYQCRQHKVNVCSSAGALHIIVPKLRRRQTQTYLKFMHFDE